MMKKLSHTARNLKSPLICIFVIMFLNACHGQTENIHQTDNLEEVSARYQEQRDYQSLMQLLPYLDVLNMKRADVESILGEGGYHPLANISYYFTDVSVAKACPRGAELQGTVCRLTSSGEEVEPSQEWPIVLVVRYSSSPGVQKDSDPLESFWLAPVGE